uniref:Putative secreted protein n=1 Tax=Amblyomma parvum TaxID=251391 RepID=A0A023G0P6_AMBPA
MRRILLVMFFMDLRLNIVASNAAQHGRNKIGEGIKVLAEVYYDSSYNKKPKSRTSSEHGTNKNSEDPFQDHFEQLLKKVEKRFNQQNVSIKIELAKVTQVTNITVPYQMSLMSIDGQKTLYNLRNYSMYLGAPNNTVHFLYTKKDIYEYSDRGDRMPLVLHDVETYRTFCTNNVSAAVVSDKSKSWDYMYSVKALASTFGCLRHTRFFKPDFDTMEETFRHCHGSNT